MVEYVVPQTTIEEVLPLVPTVSGLVPAPPAPTTTAPKAVFPHTLNSKFLAPPAPPPPERDAPPPAPPPPATIKVLINLVPGCVVTALGVFDV